MSGRSSRNKGRNAEYEVRDIFRVLGWASNRVPLSGASAYAKGDVKIEKDGQTLVAEVKIRQNEFKSIYALLDKLKLLDVSISLDGSTVLVCHDFNKLGYTGDTSLSQYCTDAKDLRTVKKIFNLKKLVKDCDFLVLRINYKPFLFVRYL